MAKFFGSPTNNVSINLDLVREVHTFWNKDRDERRTIVHFDAEHYVTLKGVYNDFVDYSPTIIPASPGFDRFDFWFFRDTEEPSAARVLHWLSQPSHREPIIAWKIDQEGGVDAVCLENEPPGHDKGCYAICRPDGAIVAIMDQMWPNIEGWAAFVCERWQRWHKEQAELKNAG